MKINEKKKHPVYLGFGDCNLTPNSAETMFVISYYFMNIQQHSPANNVTRGKMWDRYLDVIPLNKAG